MQVSRGYPEFMVAVGYPISNFPQVGGWPHRVKRWRAAIGKNCSLF